MTGIYDNRSYEVSFSETRLYIPNREKILGIYAISGTYREISENSMNSCLYIGSSTNIKKRIFEAHIPQLDGQYHCNEKIQNAWNKYGKDNFVFFILEQCEETNLLKREQSWIDYYKDNFGEKILYNISDEAGRPLLSEEDRYKISLSRKGMWDGEKNPMYKSERNGERNPFFNKTHSEKTKRIISEKAKDRFRQNGIPWKGKKHSEETKQKLREAHLGMKHTEQTKIKLSKFFKGRPNVKCQIPVKQLDLNGNLIKIWSSAREASRETGIDVSSIGRCANKKIIKGILTKSAGGFKWEKTTKEDYENFIKNDPRFYKRI